MAALAALAVLAALAAAQPAAQPTDAPAQGTRAEVSAQASVRIVSGARVTLGKAALGEPYLVSKASVRLEDGSRRPAQLVEFQ